MKRVLPLILALILAYPAYALVLGHSGQGTSGSYLSGPVAIPASTDWNYPGAVALSPGVDTWDNAVYGNYAGAIVKLGGTYFHYYIGGTGWTVGAPADELAYSKLGVATSTDGVTWTKYGSNHVIEYTTGDYEHEGIFSVAATVVDGTIHLYYGAMHHTGTPNPNSLDGHIRYTNSTDGYTFANDNLIYSNAPDEWYPVGVHYDGSTWNLYALGNSVGGYAPLKLFTGSSPTSLSGPTAVSGAEVFTGGGDLNMIGDNVALLVLMDNGATGTMTTRIIDVVNYPTLVSDPIESWVFASGRKQSAVYLDRSVSKWFMVQDDWTAENKRVYQAPASTDNVPSIRFEDFAGTGDLSANWTNCEGSGDTLSRASGLLRANATGNSGVRRNDATFPNDQYSIVLINAGLASGTGYAVVRIGSTGTGGTLNEYFLATDGVNGASHTYVGKYVNGSSSTLQNISPATPFAAGHRMKLSRHDSGASQVLRAWQDTGSDWAQVGTDISDTTHQSGGSPGFGVYDASTNNMRLDNFEGGGAGAIGGQTGPDETDPYVDNYTPPSSQTGVSVGTTSAVFHVKDDGIGVDTTTIQATRTGGVLQTCGDNLVCAGPSGDVTVTYPDLSLAYEDNVAFQIAASDLSSNAMDNVSYWFTVQSDPGAGGNLLAGDNTYGDNNVTVNPNNMYTTSFSASASGTAATAWIYYQNTNSTNCKVAIYAAGDTGALLDSVIVPVSGTGWKSASLTGAVSIVSGTSYRLGVVCNGYENIGTEATGLWNRCTSGTYTSPTDPNCKTNSGSEALDVYITD